MKKSIYFIVLMFAILFLCISCSGVQDISEEEIESLPVSKATLKILESELENEKIIIQEDETEIEKISISPSASSDNFEKHSDNTPEPSTANPTATVSEATAVIEKHSDTTIEKQSDETIEKHSDNTPSTTPEITATPTAIPTPTVSPTSSTKSNVIAVIIQKTATVSPTATPEPTDTVERCSMIDYTENALPAENKKSDVEILLAATKTGDFSQVNLTNSEMETFFYTHSYCVYYINSELGEKHSDYISLLDWADDAIAELRISRQTGVEEAVGLINRYVIKYIQYDLEIITDELYYTINSHLGVCHNYSQMFQLLCHKCGIECYYEENDTQNHAYNYIVLNGERYYTDSTWNDVKVKVGSESYEIYEAADKIWANVSADKKITITAGKFNKEQFIEYYTSTYLMLGREEFFNKHSGWSLSDSCKTFVA